MLDTKPVIPRRPKKTLDKEKSHSSNFSDAELPDGTSVPLNAAPTQNEEESLATTSENNDLIPSSIISHIEPEGPKIPKRPVKKSLSPTGPVVDEEGPKNNDVAADNNHSIEPESKLISELYTPRESQDDLLEGDGDGDKTPGNSNTKITFKDQEDDSGAPVADSSSFDDDVETVSQDKEEGSLEELRQTGVIEDQLTLPENSESVSQAVVDEQSEADTPNEDATLQEVEPIDKEQDSEEINRVSEDTLASVISSNANPENSTMDHVNLASNSELEAPAASNELEFAGSNESLKSEHGEGTTESGSVQPQIAKVPLIPSRPKKKEESTPSQGSESESSNPVTPAIPTRPKKFKPEVKEKEESEVSNEEKTKSKPPPPKPKKLSSKIAAFQQMFTQQALPLPKPSTPQERPDGSNSNKLSTDKMKFAANLQGMYGRGIALPGMVNPHMQSLQTGESKETTETGDEKETEPKPIVNERRAKGPRGKRLPKALKDPVKVEAKTRFNIVTGEIWSIAVSAPKSDVSDGTPIDPAESSSEISEILSTYHTEDLTPNTEIAPKFNPEIQDSEEKQPAGLNIVNDDDLVQVREPDSADPKDMISVETSVLETSQQQAGSEEII
ncbi:uncharacterized protein CANTADRAFT_333988 [Suhomyces tanzawaensis NRRL Y-17324]|uniref:Altered inheritance of mitochondria protein 21 n=1 Tax=Suhomyces tanzawaensis NRRL Y-17324 TaxID=984487 RepID=A0A1E4SBD9_9ASCO|nr:uncharacterized protein CANTADRAFT_333988 [Suhomyces tanzawaensis NRRL Y-17324]ODV76811.1 hypothetical protein CANTADRAFT_333988 [Suhomyces tanzawaensis NRRL Y-17324]